MNNHIVIVRVNTFGSDVGVILNGQLLLAADPMAGDDTQLVENLAENLQSSLISKPIEINYSPLDAEYNWDDIIEKLTSDGVINFNDQEYTVLTKDKATGDLSTKTLKSENIHNAMKVVKQEEQTLDVIAAIAGNLEGRSQLVFSNNSDNSFNFNPRAGLLEQRTEFANKILQDKDFGSLIVSEFGNWSSCGDDFKISAYFECGSRADLLLKFKPDSVELENH